MEKEHKTDGTPCWCNPRVEKIFPKDKLFEKLAAIEHERWSKWQNYLHGKCYRNLDGSLTISAELVKRWVDQINTPYAELTEKEKDSDREQVIGYWYLIQKYARDAYERAIKNYGFPPPLEEDNK